MSELYEVIENPKDTTGILITTNKNTVPLLKEMYAFLTGLMVSESSLPYSFRKASILPPEYINWWKKNEEVTLIAGKPSTTLFDLFKPLGIKSDFEILCQVKETPGWYEDGVGGVYPVKSRHINEPFPFIYSSMNAIRESVDKEFSSLLKKYDNKINSLVEELSRWTAYGQVKKHHLQREINDASCRYSELLIVRENKKNDLITRVRMLSENHCKAPTGVFIQVSIEMPADIIKTFVTRLGEYLHYKNNELLRTSRKETHHSYLQHNAMKVIKNEFSEELNPNFILDKLSIHQKRLPLS